MPERVSARPTAELPDAKKGLIGVHDSRKTYLDFLAAARETSLRHGKPFWNCKTR